MDPTTQQALNQFVQQILAGAQNAATWTAGQAPLVVQEWLLWQMMDAMIGLGVFSFVFGAAGVIIWRIRRAWTIRAAEGSYYGQDDYMIPIGICIGVMLFCALFMVSFTREVAKIHYAPRVVVLEKFADLIK